MKKEFTHQEDIYNLDSPREIVPEIIKLLNPKSVVDIGCGIGTFLYCFKEAGIDDVLGIDGDWVNRDLLRKYLLPNEFQPRDLEEKLNLDRQFDLVVSLEVAEHLKPESADIFIQNLVSAGHVILFSAAIPLQGGQDHINEQRLGYWEKKFEKHNYVVHDVLKSIFWENRNISFWYKQNMVIVAPKEFEFNRKVTYNSLRDIVHYDMFEQKAKMLQESKALLHGKLNSSIYFKGLIKSIIGEKTVRRMRIMVGKEKGS